MVMLPYSLGSFKNLSSCFETYEENGYRCHSDYGSMNTFLGSFIFCIYYQRVMGRREGFLRQPILPKMDQEKRGQGLDQRPRDKKQNDKLLEV